MSSVWDGLLVLKYMSELDRSVTRFLLAAFPSSK